MDFLWKEEKINETENNVQINKHAKGISDYEWEYDELLSLVGIDSNSDEEDTCGKFPTFSMPKSMADYEWEVGTYFVSKEEFIEAIRT